MSDKKYVLLYLDSIKVNIKKTTTDPIVFCQSIRVKLHDEQNINSIKDWSDIIIGEYSKYKGLKGVTEVAIAELDEITGEYTGGINEGIGLWSVILFETIKNEEGEYARLTINNAGSDGIGGAGEQESNIKEVYENTLSSINYQIDECVYDFLEDIFSTEKYNGCMFINNPDCGLFLNISPKMFNEQKNLKSIALTNTISYIADKDGSTLGVFRDCINLETANIPKYLGKYYEYNIDTNTYDILNTRRIVPSYYFYNCNKLNNISIPDEMREIEFYAFYGCDNVETINIPPSVISIGSASLVTIKRVKPRYIKVNGDNKTEITFFGKSVGYHIPSGDNPEFSQNPVIISINGRKKVSLRGSNRANDTSFIDSMGGGSKIYIDCATIEGVLIGSTANPPTRFYYGGFIGTSFETIYIGPSVSKICDFAFYNVKDTTNLVINNDIVLTTSYNTKDEDGIIKENGYPDGSFLIKTPFVKSNFNNIDILNCSTINKNALHSLKSSKLTFYEKDDIFNIEGDNVITNTITVTNTTTLKTLSERAFYNSTFSSIIIPSTVTKNDINCTNISNTAFLQTKGSLELKCDISGYVNTDIDSNEHTGILVNSEFRKIKFNYTGTIPKNVLYENKYIESIELGDEIRTISENAFYLCTNLTGILSLPTSMTSIHETSFIGCTFSKFEADSSYFKTANNGMYLLTDNGSSIVLFANRHSDIQINDNTFNIDITTVNKICSYAFAYAFSDYANSTVYAVNIPKNIKHFGSNVFYNCYKLTRIIFFGSNIPNFDDDASTAGISVYKENDFYSEINTVGSFVDLPLLKEVYIGYKNGVLLSNYLNRSDAENTWFLHNTLRKSYTNAVPSVDGITIYVHENLVDDYKIWKDAGYIIAVILDDIPSPGPPVEDDDSYDADIDDPEGEEWPWDGGNGDIITNEEDHIPPVVDNSTDNDEETTDSWIKHENNVFKIPIKQLGTPAINVYGCRLDLLHLTDSYSDERTSPTPEMIVDQFGNVDFSALDYLKFNKVSNETHYGSEYDKMLKLYMGDYGNNFLIVFTVTGIDKFDATTKLFTSGVEYATHRESNWLKTEIVRITKKPESEAYYVVLLCTCLKLQNKDNYNCRSAIVSVNYGSQILDTYVNGQTTEGITTKIRVIQHKTELRLSNDTKEINITDLPVLFCQKNERTTFTGKFFIGFPKNFWGNDYTIKDDGSSSNKNKLREYINDYFRISYDKEKIKVVGQKTKINDLDYTYIFDLDNDNKYANIKSEGSTTSTLMTFSSCADKLGNIHEEYYCVTFKIENLKTSLAGGVWNINIYNIGEPAELLNIHAVEDQTDIPSIALYPTYAKITGCSWDGNNFKEHEINTENTCSDIRDNNYVAAECQLPVSITNMPIGENANYIFPNIETTDICVSSSAVFTCMDNNMVMSADEITNNFNYALTINIKNNNSSFSSFNLPISSKTLKKQSLSAIKYKKTELAINPSIYNYDANSNNVVNACLSNTSQINIERLGDKQESDILSNTGAFLYKINTGLSVIANTYTNYLTRTGNTVTYMPIDVDTHTTTIEADYVNEENNLCIDFYNNKFIIYDEYCNVLAPIYPYYNELNYTITSSKTLQINEYIDSKNVYINTDNKTTHYINDNRLTTGPTYYCTATNNILIKADTLTSMPIQGYTNVEAKCYIGPSYKVFTNNSATPVKIGVVKENVNSVKYTEECYGTKSYNGFSNATEVVTLLPIYEVKVTGNSSQNTSTNIGDDQLQTYAADYKSHGKIVEVIDLVRVTDTVGLCCKYDEKNYYNLNGTPIVIKPNIEVEYAYFIYLNHNNINDDGTFTIPNRGGPGYVVDRYDEKPSDPYVYVNSGKITETRFYRIYNITVDNALGKYTNVNDVINKNGIYKDFNIPGFTVEEKPYKMESFNIADTHVNTYDIACNTNVYRQIFVNFSYNVNDNNTITKIYADNSNGLILQTRMLNNSITTTPTFNPNIILFGLNIASSTNNIGFTSSTINPQLPQFQAKQ